MSDSLPDSQVYAEPWCPGCSPHRDPTTEILETRHCDAHTPKRDGAEDAAVTSEAFLSGSAEAGGEENRRWCEFLHRAKR